MFARYFCSVVLQQCRRAASLASFGRQCSSSLFFLGSFWGEKGENGGGGFARGLRVFFSRFGSGGEGKVDEMPVCGMVIEPCH